MDHDFLGVFGLFGVKSHEHGLSNIGDSFEGIVDLLCINSDHVHLYIEPSPDYSVDEIVNKIVPFFELNLQKQLPKYFEGKKIFQKSYFIESIG